VTSPFPSPEARLAAIVESAADAILGLDLEGIVVAWNAAAERIFGWTAGEIVGRPVTTLVPPERRGEVPGIFDRVRAGGYVAGFETVRMRKNGERFAISATVSPVRGPDGAVAGISIVVREVGVREMGAGRT